MKNQINNQMQIFEHKEFGKIRTVSIDGEPWFIGKDITDILGYGNGSRDLNRHVDAEDRRNYRNGTSEINNRGVTVINESGLYSLILYGNTTRNGKAAQSSPTAGNPLMTLSVLC